jgi:signal transduction histidine kinase
LQKPIFVQVKHIVFILLCFLVTHAPVKAQTGSKAADALLDSARHYVYTNAEKSYKFINGLSIIAKKESNHIALAYSHLVKGIIDEQIGDNESALYNYTTGIELADKAKDAKAKLRISIALSNYYLNRSDFQKCIEICHKGISDAMAIYDYETASQFYNNLSICHNYMQDYENALVFGDKSLEMKIKTDNEESLGNAYLNMGLILTNKGDYDKGFDYYSKAEAIFLKFNNHISLTQTYINYAWDNTDLKQFQKARSYLDQALIYGEKSGDKIRQAGVWNAFGYYYNKSNQKDSASYALEKGLGLSLQSDNKRNALIAYQELANHYQSVGDEKNALQYLNKAYKLKDIIFEETKIHHAQTLNARFETQQKEEQINLLNAQKQNDEYTIQIQRLILFIILLFLVIACLLSFFLFNRYRRKQKTIKEEELQTQKEAERIRIARDMHDEVGAGLTRIVMRSEQVKSHLLSGKELKNGIVETFEKMSAESRLLSHNLGEIIWALNPKNDSSDELFSYIRNYAFDYLDEAGISCKINFPEQIPVLAVSPDIRRNVFLMVKESLNNIVKHSMATHAELTLKLSEKHFSLVLKDNGKGTDNDFLTATGNGLKNMKKRIEEAGGKSIFISEPGKGTEVHAEQLPYEKNQTKV